MYSGLSEKPINEREQQFAHVIMEAKKFHNTPSVNWRTMKARGIQPESKGPRARSADVQRQNGCPA